MKGICRILKVPFSESNKLASLIEPAIELAQATNPKAKTLKDAMQVDGSELKGMYDRDEQLPAGDPMEGKTVGVKKIVDLAVAIEGIKNNTGTHAAGVIIAPEPLDHILPVQPSKDGIVQTGYPPHDVTEVLSLLKMDFWGFETLQQYIKLLI